MSTLTEESHCRYYMTYNETIKLKNMLKKYQKGKNYTRNPNLLYINVYCYQ
jgi:hypothetical protein